MRTKKRKKLQRPRLPMEVPAVPNQRWSMDFVADQLSNGRRFRILNIVDDFSRELVGQLIGFSIPGHQVVRYLSELAASRGLPRMITMDNGSEFTSKAMHFWSRNTGVKLGFIQPGKPTQNAFVESFNGKFRNECLNQYYSRSLSEAKSTAGEWRDHCLQVRPQSSLGYLPPVEFAKRAA